MEVTGPPGPQSQLEEMNKKMKNVTFMVVKSGEKKGLCNKYTGLGGQPGFYPPAKYKLQPMKTFAWRFWYPRVALMRLRPRVFILCYFMFMKLRPQVFILCKNVTIEFSWISVSCFQPVQECHHLVFIKFSLMFSACARVSPFNFHESQSHVLNLCMHFTAYFSWISGPWFQPLWTISTFIFSYSLTPFHGFMFQSCQIHAPKPAAIPQKKTTEVRCRSLRKVCTMPEND